MHLYKAWWQFKVERLYVAEVNGRKAICLYLSNHVINLSGRHLNTGWIKKKFLWKYMTIVDDLALPLDIAFTAQ
jgi:hypothetical protein